jgi:hypothetical protein
VSQDGGKAWTVSLICPSGFISVFDAVNDRPMHKHWRTALETTVTG